MAPPCLTSPILPFPHGFFSREGGVSSGIYASLNTGPGSDDAPEDVSENRARCARALGADAGKLLTLYQVHSAKVVTVDTPWPHDDKNAHAPEADGFVTKTPGITLGILTADCMPFLFADANACVIGAAHAGWRGALGGVLENTIEKMVSLGAKPENIKAALGPCLRQLNFEVGLELVDAFTDKHPEAEQFFTSGVSDEKRQFDLAGFGRLRLASQGVTQLYDTGVCTLGEKERYFSYRASRRAKEPDYGRNLSAIVLPE